ncbi:MAG: hypothetical protein V8S38_02765 [Lachnospiraceae bacterium]
MQLIYGNDGENYRTIAKTQDITAAQEKKLLSGYLGYEFVRDMNLYSSVAKEPIAFTYVTTSLSGTMGEKILLAKNARMTNYATPSSYAHFRFFEQSEQLYGKDFFSLLRTGFSDGTDFAECTIDRLDLFERKNAEYIPKQDALEKEKLEIVVAAVLTAADSLSDQVKLILDVEGDEYNRRALDVIASVYACIPYNIRKKAGFSTYAGASAVIPGQVKLQIYPRDAYEKLKGHVIDLAKISFSGKPTTQIEKFAHELVEMSEEQREMWFHEFQNAFGLQKVSVNDHIQFYHNIDKWKNGAMNEMWDDLAAYAFEEKNRKSPLYKVFQNVIGNRIEKEDLTRFFRAYVKSLLNRQTNLSFTEDLRKYLALGEAIDTLSFEQEDFRLWENQNILDMAAGQYTDEEEQCKYLETVKEQMKTQNPGGRKFKEILGYMADVLDDHIQDLHKRIKEKKESEASKITTQLMKMNWNECNYEEVQRIQKYIRYEENKEIFTEVLAKSLKSYLDEPRPFKDIEQYQRFSDMLKRFDQLLEPRTYQELIATSKRKGSLICSIAEVQKNSWENCSDIENFYKKFVVVISQLNGSLALTNIELSVAGEKVDLNRDLLELLLEYILFVKHTDERIRKLLTENENLFLALLKIKSFDERHLESLFQFFKNKDERLRSKLLNYYLSSDVMLRKSTVNMALKYAGSGAVKKAGKNHYDNMLGLALKERRGNGKIKIVIIIAVILLIAGVAGGTAVWLLL